MRKTFLILIGALLFASCEREAVYQDAIFGYRLVEEYSMTKAISHASVKSTIAAAIPTTIKPAFYFNNDETQGQNITMGQSVTMKVGTYGVRWNNTPNNIVNVVNGNTNFAKSPLLDIDTEITIAPGTTEYTIPVTFKSFAIVADATEISKAQYYTVSGSYSDIDFFVTSGDNLIIFINGEFTSDGVARIRLIPADSYRKETTFFLSNQVESVGKNPTIHVDYGKYYVLHPDAVTEVGSLFNLVIPEWECGNEED